MIEHIFEHASNKAIAGERTYLYIILIMEPRWSFAFYSLKKTHTFFLIFCSFVRLFFIFCFLFQKNILRLDQWDFPALSFLSLHTHIPFQLWRVYFLPCLRVVILKEKAYIYRYVCVCVFFYCSIFSHHHRIKTNKQTKIVTVSCLFFSSLLFFVHL